MRLPRQVPYIIGNEACERFSFYGMRNILTPFLVSTLLLYAPEADRPGIAKDVFHSFVIGVYFFPLLGGWLSDRYFGKYHTVLWFSLIYCGGHAMLAAFDDNRAGFYTGLFLIAFGSGGIKPLVVSFVGDQFSQANKALAKVVFDAFYWSINFGSFFASLLMPIFLRRYGPAVAFGIPGILMGIATLLFWMGRKQYVRVPRPAAGIPIRFSTSPAVRSPHGPTATAGLAWRSRRWGFCWQRRCWGAGRSSQRSGRDSSNSSSPRAWPSAFSSCAAGLAPRCNSSAPGACTLMGPSTMSARSCGS